MLLISRQYHILENSKWTRTFPWGNKNKYPATLVSDERFRTSVISISRTLEILLLLYTTIGTFKIDVSVGCVVIYNYILNTYIGYLLYIEIIFAVMDNYT